MNRPFAPTWLRSLAASALVAVVLAPVAAQPPAAADPVVELPRFLVTDSRELPPPESWRYATIAGFEILTNGSDRATQRLLRDFDMFRQALGYVWPVPNQAGVVTPLIIAGRGNKFDGFVPAGKSRAESTTASLLLKKGDRTAIVIDLQATTLNVLNMDGPPDPTTGVDGGMISVEHDKQLYREYVRFLLSGAEPRLPAWFEEGLSQIIMKMKFDKRWIEFAKLDDPNAVSAAAAATAGINAAMLAEDPEAAAMPGAPAEDLDFNAALQRRALVPLAQFFAVTADSPEALNPLGNNRWAKQAYAFVHLGLYGYKGKYQKAFTQFLQRATREPVTEAMFKECWGMTYKEMLLQIRSYCDYTYYQHKEYRFKEDAIVAPPPLALREATQSEVGRIKGEAMLLAGHNAAARTELIAPYVRGERDPELLASLGLYENSHGEAGRARKFLEAAVAGKARRADAYIELARFRFADALAAGPGNFKSPQVDAIIGPLMAARRLPPPRLALYDLAADTLMRGEARATRDQAALAIEGARLFPQRMKLVYQAGALSADAQLIEAAHALADHGLRFSRDAATRQSFTELKSALPPMPAALSSAAPAPATPPSR